jgi:type VI secretion system protein
MAITISVVNAPLGARYGESSRVFSEQGGTIGRGERNTWVLDDPEKYLSSCHCSITCEGGSYYITDLSTNGTYLNHAPAPLGKGVKSILKDGDSFEMGSYSMQVKLQASTNNSNVFGKPSSLAPDPFAQPVKTSSDNFAFDTGGSFSNSSSGPFFEEDTFGKGLDTNDPLAALDKRSPQSNSFSAPVDPYQFGGSQQQGGLAISDAFNMPNVLPADNIIPEDWGDDDLMSDFMSEPVSTIARQPKPQPEVIVPQPQVIEPTIAIAKPIKVQQPVQEPIAPVTTKANTVSNAAANSALVRAMGLEGLSPEEIEKVAETVGELMPVIVDGMMKLLRSRASIKNEFRMNMTTIQPVENNPLKFSVNPKDALENMFVRKNSAYKGAVESFTEGFDGIVDHQIAIIAGMRSAFKGMMDRFDPEKLEKQFDKQSKGVTLPGMQKVKYWNSYAEHFASYAENMEQSFRHLFGDDFVQAYENQIFKLVSARRKAARNDQ